MSCPVTHDHWIFANHVFFSCWLFSVEQKKAIARCKNVATQEISQSLLEETLKNEVGQIADESYKEAKAERRNALSQIGHTIRLYRTARYFQM